MSCSEAAADDRMAIGVHVSIGAVAAKLRGTSDCCCGFVRSKAGGRLDGGLLAEADVTEGVGTFSTAAVVR